MKNTVRLCFEKDDETRRRITLRFVVKDFLGKKFGIVPSMVYCLHDFSHIGYFDITFAAESTCLDFWEDYKKKRTDLDLIGVYCWPLFFRETRLVTVHMFSAYVKVEDIVCFLSRYCTSVQYRAPVLNEFGIWSGKQVFLVRLKNDPDGIGGVLHLPKNFSLGSVRGSLFYAGQPLFCRKCQRFGHVQENCTEDIFCRNCKKGGHMARDCREEKKCNACGVAGHLFRNCTMRRVSFAEIVRRDSSGMRPGRQEEEVEGSGSERHVAGEEKTAKGDGEVAGPSSVSFPLQVENEYDGIAELFDPISMISDWGSTDNREAEELVE